MSTIVTNTNISNGVINQPIIQDGLIAFLDPSNSISYKLGSSTMTNLVDYSTADLNGTYSDDKEGKARTIRLSNTSSNKDNNVSYIQLQSLTNITTVSVWYYQHSGTTTRYLLDMREGGSNGWIYTGGPGGNWSSGTLYKNGGSSQSITWANIETLNQWQNITVIANTPATDDMNLFSRYTDEEGLDVTFGLALVYNRVLSQSENTYNYNVVKTRFGL
jgi:hypothetical protein